MKDLLRHKITQNTLAQLLGRGVIILLTLGLTFGLRRYLGRDGYGAYVYFLNFSLLFVSLADLGTHLTLVQQSAVKTDKHSLLGTALSARLSLGLAVAVLAYLASYGVSIPAGLEPIRWIISIWILALILKETVAVLYHAFEQLTGTSVVQVVSTLLQLVLVLVMITTQASLSWLLVVSTLSLLVLSAGAIQWFRNRHQIPFILKGVAILAFIKTSIPLGATLLIFTIYSKTDTLLIQHFYGEAAVGSYGLAYKVYENLLLPAAFILNAALPELSRHSHASWTQLVHLWQRLGLTLGLGALGLSFLVWIFSPTVLPWLTGDSAESEIFLLRILLLGVIFAYGNHLTGYSLIAIGKTKLSLGIAVVALIFNVVSNWWLLPILGLAAAAWLTVATEGIVLVLTGLVLYKVRPFDPSGSLSSNG